MENTQQDKIQELIDVQKEIHNQNVNNFKHGIWLKSLVFIGSTLFFIAQNIPDKSYGQNDSSIFIYLGSFIAFISAMYLLASYYETFSYLTKSATTSNHNNKTTSSKEDTSPKNAIYGALLSVAFILIILIALSSSK